MLTLACADETDGPDGGVVIWYTNGENCPNSQVPGHTNRTSVFHISCLDGTNSLKMSQVYEDSCWYEI